MFMKIPLLMIAALWSAAPATAAVISFSPNPATTSVGDVFTLDVLVTDVLDLYGFEFNLAFDPGVVRVNDTFAGSFLALGGATFFIPGLIDNAAGTVSFVADTLIGPDRGSTVAVCWRASNFRPSRCHSAARSRCRMRCCSILVLGTSTPCRWPEVSRCLSTRRLNQP